MRRRRVYNEVYGKLGTIDGGEGTHLSKAELKILSRLPESRWHENRLKYKA